MNLPDHGANPLRFYNQMGIKPPESWVDYSENIHPFGPPAFIKESWNSFYQLLDSYPDPQAEPFRAAAADFHKIEAGWVAAGNGAAEVFTWLARRYRGKRVILVEPAFSEYRRTLETENVEIAIFRLTADNGWKLDVDALNLLLDNCSALYICNPHNPTGNLVDTADLAEIAANCAAVDCELVIDEAFIDFISEDASFSSILAGHPNVIIVRSMTKMFALAGIRLGYVMARPEIISELIAGAAHWNVNALAAKIGSRCFQEEEYRERVILAAREELMKMKHFFQQQNCCFTDASANFLCFKLPDGKDSSLFFLHMLKKGIILRHTYSFREMNGKWFRIGMKSATAMEKLREEVSLWLEEN